MQPACLPNFFNTPRKSPERLHQSAFSRTIGAGYQHRWHSGIHTAKKKSNLNDILQHLIKIIRSAFFGTSSVPFRNTRQIPQTFALNCPGDVHTFWNAVGRNLVELQQTLQNECVLRKVGVDTAEDEPSQVEPAHLPRVELTALKTFPPQTSASAGLRVFGAKMPIPFFFMAATFFFAADFRAILPAFFFSAFNFALVAYKKLLQKKREVAPEPALRLSSQLLSIYWARQALKATEVQPRSGRSRGGHALTLAQMQTPVPVKMGGSLTQVRGHSTDRFTQQPKAPRTRRLKKLPPRAEVPS